MKANHDQEEGCLLISMTEEDASMCFDAIEAMLSTENVFVPPECYDALMDLMTALNLE
ncbi:hypothetical protein OGY07_19340 [Citrobacter sp. Cs237]|uniref:hypothetical protein n=1 Tax=Citrobacter sp. Cs237 TaxID=2985156 RepID=UPI00257706BD|nr:hypothetical protein [Citrobacter sp. Cs237]MDM2751483.1 hypothetical protein [Citrobacter sp. Cs237]